MKINKTQLQNIIDSLNYTLFDIDETVIDTDDAELVRVLEYMRNKLRTVYVYTNNYLLRIKEK